MRQKIAKLTPELARLAKAAFPEYKGRKWYTDEAESVNCRSYWDGGSKDFYVFVRLSDAAVLPMPTSHPGFDKVPASIERMPVPDTACVVRRAVSCGKEAGLTFIFAKLRTCSGCVQKRYIPEGAFCAECDAAFSTLESGDDSDDPTSVMYDTRRALVGIEREVRAAFPTETPIKRLLSGE